MAAESVNTEPNVFCNGCSWKERSFLIEMKPRQEFASLFVDCPPSVLCDAKIYGQASENTTEAELVRVGDQFLELVEESKNVSSLSELDFVVNENVARKFSAKLTDILLDPSSVCALSWADQHRLFMCKVRAEADGIPFSPKAFRRFEDEISSSFPLRDYVSQIEGSNFNVVCRNCERVLHMHSVRNFEFHILPDDDWLDTSPSMDYYCGQTCGGHTSSSLNHHGGYNEGLLGFSNLAESTKKWLPNNSRIVLTNSFIIFLESDMLKSAINIGELGNQSILSCIHCSSQVGTLLKNHSNVYKFHATAVRVFGADPKDCYIANRFGSFERYFAWMLLYKSESQSSMKLLIRNYVKVPYLLVWILEPYVILTRGTLMEEGRLSTPPVSSSSSTESSSISCSSSISSSPPNHDFYSSTSSFPALKVLYKIYDADSAASDPRANGMDSSVGIVDVPLSCCLHLIETLLSSSHALPPSFRAVGQLYVGFLRLKDHVD